MKRWLSVAAIVVLCLALVIGVACGEEEEEEEGVTELKFGIGVQLSGLFAPIVGIPVKRGYELEAERIGVFEVGGKEYRWKVIAEDNLGGSAEGGVASATKFIYEDDVDFMFQAGSGAAMGAQPLCEESGIIADMGTSEFEAFGPDKRYSIQAAPCTAAAIIPFYDWVAKEHPEVKHIVMALMDAPITGAYNEVLASDAHEYFGFESDIVWIPEGTTE